ncbi:MAG: glycosyltransferase family 4 protein [Propionicimonas sp.]
MKICFLVGRLQYSGAEHVLRNLAKGMLDHGHDVNIILSDPEAPPNDGVMFPIERTHQMTRTGRNRVRRVILRWSELRRRVANISPEIVVSFGYANNINAIIALLGLRTALVVCERVNPKSLPATRTARTLRRFLYGLAQGLVVQTAEILTFFPRNIRRTAAVIPNPVLEEPRPIPENSSRSRASRIISIGRLSDDDKNQSLMLRAFARVAAEFPEWTLEIYGEGPDRDLYLGMIDDLGVSGQVNLPGYSTDPLTELANSSIFALSSRSEGMPNALIEAMSLGLPCIATDCDGGGARALTLDGVAGILVPNEDVEQFSKAMRSLMRDPDLREQLGAAALYVNRDLSFETILSKWTDYLNVVSINR